MSPATWTKGSRGTGSSDWLGKPPVSIEGGVGCPQTGMEKAEGMESLAGRVVGWALPPWCLSPRKHGCPPCAGSCGSLPLCPLAQLPEAGNGGWQASGSH